MLNRICQTKFGIEASNGEGENWEEGRDSVPPEALGLKERTKQRDLAQMEN
jgi:hypothetical protein